MKTTLLLILALSLGTMGCKQTPEEQQIVGNTYSELEQIVIDNAYIVRDAAQAFADQNGGAYPQNVTDLKPFLPDGQLFENPYHHVNTCPIDGSAAYEGEIGYMPNVSPQGAFWGYYITGYGDSDVIITLVSPEE